MENDHTVSIPVHFILDLVDLLLEKNYFRSEDNFYYQTKGVSVGSSFAPSVANLFMASLEDNQILNQDSNPFFMNICLFYRYIDDCFCVYRDKDLVQEFVCWLNTLHPSIKFTSEANQSQVSFLDTTTYRTLQHTLAVKPFVKATDMNTYLHFSSYHPRHPWTNISHGQFLRLKRNSTEMKDFKQHSEQLCYQFLKRGYPKGVIQSAVAKGADRDRSSLFDTKEQSMDQPLYAALEFTPQTN